MDLQDHGFYGNKRRYSVTDMATAGTYGYHLVSTATGAPGTVDQSNLYGLGRLSAAKTAVMTGFVADGGRAPRSATGRQVPAGGCAGVADARLAGSGPVGEAKPVSEAGRRVIQPVVEEPDGHRGVPGVVDVHDRQGVPLQQPGK